MSLDIPAELQIEIDRYAQDEHISPETATVQLIQRGLAANMAKAPLPQISQAEIEELKARIPLLAYFANLPDNVVESLEQTSQEIRSETLASRG
jgi:hypothetical protein